jgi:leader peptidase (prepilin peptidase)/N-methyltransferase
LFLVPVGAAIAAIDMMTLIIPIKIVWPAAMVMAVLCSVAGLASGQPLWMLGALVGAAALTIPLFGLWFMIPGGMGFGDVRLAVLLGTVVGFAASAAGRSWPLSAVLSLLTLGISALIGLIMAIPGAMVGVRKVPFGPALVLGSLLAATLAGPLLRPFG